MHRNVTSFFLLIGLSAAQLQAQSSEQEEIEIIKPSATDPTTLGKADVAQVAKMIVDQTNVFRRNQDLKPVQPDSQLNKAAEYFASWMAKEDKYGHTADGNRPAQRAKKFGYQYCIVLENIAYQYRTSDFATGELAGRFVQGWKDSPGHRENMLDPDVTETGVAVAQSKESGYYYAVQMFGRPQSQQIEFSLFNRSKTTVEYAIGKKQFSLPPRYRRTHTRCRPPEVSFSGSGLNEKLQPANGSRYVIESAPEKGLRIQKQ